MESKPVIILGGGLWGSLLAYRLQMALPHIPFRLYERSSTLGGHESYTFHGSDIDQPAKVWLRPLVTQSWSTYQVRFPKYEKRLGNSLHLINSEQLHDVISANLLSERLCLNNEISARLALNEASFVIDTRNICGYKKCGYQKYLAMEIELLEPHKLKEPIMMDSTISQRDRFRCIHYLPISEKKLLIKDQRFSENAVLDLLEMKNDILKVISFHNWKVKKVVREESHVKAIPMTSPSFRQEGRVINLAGLFHDTTGCSLPTATRLIEKMVATSFRLGELKEVVANFRKETESDRKFLRFLNRYLVDSVPEKQHCFFQDIYQLPQQSLERFLRGKLSLLDRSRIMLGKFAH